jgi:rod shape-determining protein MreC
MNSRSGNRFLRGQWVVYGLLVTLSVGMMGASGSHTAATIQSDANYMLNPVEVALDDTADTVVSYWSAILQLDNVRTENQQLRQENQNLTEELARMGAISQLNTDWTKVSQAQQSSQYQTTIARVVVRNITDIGPRTFIINRGVADGISLGEVVIDDGGAVVGRVLSVQTYDATILLVNDTSAVVIGEEADTGAIGTIQGEISGLLQMSYVNSTDKLSKGQTVVTAGMVLDEEDVRSPYPPGLLVGTIVSVSRDPNQVVQSAVVQPAADLDNIDWVLVISNYQGGFTSPEPSASPSSSASSSLNPKSTPTPATPRVTPTPGPTPTPPPGIVTPPPH